MQTIQTITDNPVYKQILADSFGGMMYDVANQNKYEALEIIALWDSLSDSLKDSAGGIMKGALSFVKGN